MLKTEDIQEFNTTIKRGLLDRIPRQLLITPDFISFENKSSASGIFTKFYKDEITDYRYGINWIRGLEFTIGREFLFYVRNSSMEVLKINFKTFYNIKKKESYKLSNDVLNSLWKFHFGLLANKLFNALVEGKEVTIGKATLTNEVIIVKENGIIKDDYKTFYWDDLKAKDYHTYFAI